MKTGIPIVFASGAAESFRLSHLERFDDNSGWHAELALASFPFACSQYSFYFDHLEKFLKQVRRMYESLSGTARLGHTHEHDYIELAMESRGHLRVSGLLSQQSSHEQELKFSFHVDQSYLPPLILSVEQVLESVIHAEQKR